MSISQPEAHLLKLFEQARVIPARNPIAAERGRKHFLELVEILRPSRVNSISPVGGLSRRLAWAVASILLSSALLLSGFGVARAASGTLPTEALYPVKIAIEDLQIALSIDDAADAYLLLQFSQRRIDEIMALAGQGQFEQIAVPTNHYRSELLRLTAIIAGLIEAGEPRADQLSSLFTEKLIEHERTLSSLLETLSPAEISYIETALSFSKEALDSIEALLDFGIITDLLPNRGKQGQTLTLEISGEGTQFGSNSMVNFGSGVRVNWIYAESNEHLIVNITIAETASLGEKEVSITTGSQTIGGVYFEVEDGASLEPSGEDSNENEGQELDDAEEETEEEGDDDNELEGNDGPRDGQQEDGGEDGEQMSDDGEVDEESDGDEDH